MYRSLRVKMFEIDPPGRFLFAAGKCTAHFEQDVAQVPTLSRFALCFFCCHLRFSSKRRYVDTGFLYMVIKWLKGIIDVKHLFYTDNNVD